MRPSASPFKFWLSSSLSIVLFLFTLQLNSQTCIVPGGQFADVAALETHLATQIASQNCTEIIIDGDIEFSCASNPTTLDITGPNIDLISVITGSAYISNCSSVQTIDGFYKLRSVEGNFEVFGNNVLTTVGDFDNLLYVGERFRISFNFALITLGNFNNLCSVGGEFEIGGNDVLMTIGNFNNLNSVGTNFLILLNSSMTKIGNFDNLLSVGEQFLIFLNSSMTKIGNFDNLSSVGRTMEISFNDELTSIGDFKSLCSVGECFEINDNDNLTSIGDFNNLCSVEERFEISNDALTTLGNFNNLCFVGSDFRLRSNQSLSSCCTFKNIFDSEGISGSIFIFNNADGCNSQDEIQECPDDPITTECIENVTVPLSDCGTAFITPCSLIDGPCCGFTASTGGIDIGDRFGFGCEDIGEHIFSVDNGAGIDCEITVTVVGDIPVATIDGPTLICAAGSTTLTASGGDFYAWSTGETTATITVSPLENTTYSVNVSNSLCGCSDEASVEVLVEDCDPIPTLGQWGLIILGLLLLIFGVNVANQSMRVLNQHL